jgi:hypothetical protein
MQAYTLLKAFYVFQDCIKCGQQERERSGCHTGEQNDLSGTLADFQEVTINRLYDQRSESKTLYPIFRLLYQTKIKLTGILEDNHFFS